MPDLADVLATAARLRIDLMAEDMMIGWVQSITCQWSRLILLEVAQALIDQVDAYNLTPAELRLRIHGYTSTNRRVVDRPDLFKRLRDSMLELK